MDLLFKKIIMIITEFEEDMEVRVDLGGVVGRER